MKISPETFIHDIQEALELERDICLTDEFRDYDEWDSLAFLSLVTLLRDTYGLTIDAGDFNDIDTWEDIIHYAER